MRSKSYYWFRVYGADYLSDPKVRNFTATHHSCWFHLLCFASTSSTPGIVKNLTDEMLAQYAGVSKSFSETLPSVSLVTQDFERFGMMKRHDNGDIEILNWEKRQVVHSDSYERLKRWREKKRDETFHDNGKSRVEKSRVEKNNNKPATQGVAKPLKASKYDPLGADIIKALEAIDPKNKTYYANKTQRAACDFLLKEYGLDETLKRIKVLPKTNQLSYFPTITTPVQLRDKWVQLQDAVTRKRGEVEAKKPKII